MRALVIDNYDSFTYNLVYILRHQSLEVDVYRNDKIEPDECLTYDAVFLSPGPGVPKDAGNLMAIIECCSGKVPLFGICLGHQAIAEYLGGELINIDKVYHGVQSEIFLVNDPGILFKELPKPFKAGRYHSWEVAGNGQGENFEIVAVDKDQSVMAIQNVQKKLFGIQFHPESILTPDGVRIIQNFLNAFNPG